MEQPPPRHQLRLPQEDSTSSEFTLEDGTAALEVLIRAASCGDVGYFKSRLPCDQNLRRLLAGQDQHGNTALHWASRFGHADFVDEVLERCRTPNRPASVTSHEQPPPDHPHHGADARCRMPLLYMTNSDGDTAAHEAIRNNHVGVAMTLLNESPSFSAVVNGDSESLLYLAAERGLEEVVKRLLQQGPECRVDGPKGRTALHAAVKSRSASVIVALLPNGREDALNQKADGSGNIPLHHAVHLGDKATMSMLLSSTTVHHRNNRGNTPFHMAAMAGRIQVMRVLIERHPETGAAINKRGKNALHLAVQHERTNVVDFILREPRLRGLVYQRDTYGNGPLHLAAMHGNLQILRLLLNDARVEKLARNRNDRTAFDVLLKNKQFNPTLQWYEAHSLMWAAIPQVPISTTTNRLGDDVDEEEQQLMGILQLDEVARKEIRSKVEKDRSSIMTLATLVAAVTFAAAFTVPGGYISSDDSGQPADRRGLPVLLQVVAFKVFIISDVVTMGSSLAAMFLCVYATWDDIETVHPHWLGIRLLMMFSFAGMSTAFASGMYTILAPETLWLATLVCAVCGSLPFVTYVWAKSRALKLLFGVISEPQGPLLIASRLGRSSAWSR